MNFEVKECFICKTEFKPKRSKSTTCSKRCYKKLKYNRTKMETKKCSVCSKYFTTKRKETTMCSQACVNKNTKNKDIVKKCELCEKEFSISYIKRDKRFCSKSCSAKFTNRMRDKELVGYKISKKIKEGYSSGRIQHPFLGKNHSEETKNKISKHHLENKTFSGAKNPMYGKKHTKESRERMSKTRTEKILNGEYSGWFSKGSYYSKKMKREIPFRSSWEEQVYKILDKDENIISYIEEPLTINYYFNEKYKRHYIPDLLVTYKDGKQKIIEIKPEFFTTAEKNKAKFKAAREFCNNKKWLFEVWTEKTIETKLQTI